MIKPTLYELKTMQQILGVDTLTSKLDKLGQYVEMVLTENQKHNLIGSSTVNNIWSRHIIDSLQLFPYLQNTKNVVDLGSGAGFPAIIIAICIDAPVVLIEKSPVKAKFLQTVVNDLRLTNVAVRNVSLNTDNCIDLISNNAVITSRAFKSVKEILRLLHNVYYVNKILLLKGQFWKQEIDDTERTIMQKWRYQAHNSVLKSGVVLELTSDYNRARE